MSEKVEATNQEEKEPQVGLFNEKTDDFVYVSLADLCHFYNLPENKDRKLVELQQEYLQKWLAVFGNS